MTVRDALDAIQRDIPSCVEVDHLVEFVRASERGITI
jgi:hypothetical protein